MNEPPSAEDVQWLELRYNEMFENHAEIDEQLKVLLAELEVRVKIGEPTDELMAEATRLSGELMPALQKLLSAKVELDAAYAAREAAMPPLPEPERTPKERADWISLLTGTILEARQRYEAARCELDAMGVDNLTERMKSAKDSEEMLAIMEASHPEQDRRIELFLELERAAKDTNDARDALERTGFLDDDDE